MIIGLLFLLEGILFSYLCFNIFRSNARNHLALLFITAILFFFNFLAPLYGFLKGTKILFNNNIGNYYQDVVLNYLIAILGFCIGYFIIQRKCQNVKKKFSITSKEIPVKFLRSGLFIALAAFVIWGITSGKSLSNIFLMGFFGLSNVHENFSDIGGNNYILLLIEGFIPLLILSYYSRMSKMEFLIWLVIAVVIYLSQGFRYRFILLLAGFLLVFLKNSSKISSKRIFMLTIIMIFCSYGILEISKYRSSIRKSVEGVQLDQGLSNDNTIVDVIFASTRNYLAFASLIKYMETKDISFGYGETMFGHIFVSIIPNNFFHNNIKPQPPALVISARSWDDQEALSAGEAYGGVGGAYVEFGTIGVLFFFFLLGRITYFLDDTLNNSSNQIFQTLCIVTIVCFFKIVTRGYLPEFFFVYGFIIIPFIFLRIFFPALLKRHNYSSEIPAKEFV